MLGRSFLHCSGQLASDVAFVLCHTALWQVCALVDRGAVEVVLTRFEPSAVPIHAVWPSTRVLPAKTQLFVDFLAARLKELAL